MKNLQSLVQLVTKHKQKKIKIDPKISKINNLYNQVFHGILNKKITSENQLANEYLKCRYQSGKYRLFLFRFKNEIFKLFYNFDLDDKNQKKTYREHRISYQKMIAMQILQDNGMGEEAVNIAKTLLLSSRKYDLFQIEAECLDVLSYQANLKKDTKSYIKYKKELEKCIEQKYIHIKAMNIYNDIKIMIENTTLTNEKIIKTVNSKLKQFNKLKVKTKNESLELNSYMLKVLFLHVTNQHNKCIKICKLAQSWIYNSNSLKSNYTIIGYFEYQKLISYLHLNEMIKAKQTAKICLSLIPEQDINQLAIYDVYILICFNNRNYYDALNAYKDIKNHPRSKFLGQVFNERLEVFEGYLSFLSSQYQLSLENDSVFNNIRNFDFDVFYKRVSVYKSDKKGIHVAMLVLQILHYLQNNRFDMITQRMESLMKYRQTYLRKDDNYRVNCFLKMLSILERLYNPVDAGSLKEIRAKSHKFLVKMNKNRIKMEKVFENYEIIPFEHLWEEIMSMLEKRHFPHKFKDKGISV